MKVILNISVDNKGNSIELWHGPEELTCVPAVGDNCALYKGGGGPSAKVEERTWAFEEGVTLRLSPVKVAGNVSSAILMGQGWVHDRPYFR